MKSLPESLTEARQDALEEAQDDVLVYVRHSAIGAFTFAAVMERYQADMVLCGLEESDFAAGGIYTDQLGEVLSASTTCWHLVGTHIDPPEEG